MPAPMISVRLNVLRDIDCSLNAVALLHLCANFGACGSGSRSVVGRSIGICTDPMLDVTGRPLVLLAGVAGDVYSGCRPLRDDIPDRTAIATCVAVGRKLGRDGVCCSLRRVRAELPRPPSPPSTSACAVDTADAEHEYAAQPKSTPISTCSPPPPTSPVSLCPACIPQRPDGPSTTENKTIRANQDQRPPRSTDHLPTRGEPRPHCNTQMEQSSHGGTKGPSLGAKHPAHAARSPGFSNTGTSSGQAIRTVSLVDLAS